MSGKVWEQGYITVHHGKGVFLARERGRNVPIKIFIVLFEGIIESVDSISRDGPDVTYT